MSVFSDKLKAAIDSCGIPVAELAKQAGISASMLYKIQSGSRLPDGLETLNRLLDSMLCALPEKLDLIQEYRTERIGQGRYAYFQDFKGMLGDVVGFKTVEADRGGGYSDDFPQVIHGIGNVNAVIRTMLERETLLDGGIIDMQMPFRNSFAVGYLSQVLMDCNPKFDRVRHMFALKATATEDALLHNMKAIRAVLPRLISMSHYDPWYCYMPDPEDNASMFPYAIITSTAVLLISVDYQHGIYLKDRQICTLYRQRFEEVLKNFRPLMRGGQGGFADFIHSYGVILQRLAHPPRPITLAAAPCVLPCIDREVALRYLPPEVARDPQAMGLVEEFYSHSSVLGHTSFYSMEGLMELLKTGRIMEIQGREVPRFAPEEIFRAVERMLQWAKQGLVTLCLFRQDPFQGESRISMALYDSNTLFVGCEIPDRDAVFSDVNEKTLCRIMKEYTEYALQLGDIFSPEESIMRTEHALRRFRAQT